jgi:hypothetical protein
MYGLEIVQPKQTNLLMFEKSYLINVFLRIVNQLLLSVVLMLSWRVTNCFSIASSCCPVLMYGLEIVQPKQTNLKKLEVFQKNILKQILSLPTNAPDPAIYIISGYIFRCLDAPMTDTMLLFRGSSWPNSVLLLSWWVISIWISSEVLLLTHWCSKSRI